MAQKNTGPGKTVRTVIKRYKCQPCQEQSKKIMATSWCTECLVPLCMNCHKHHESLKLTKYHHVVSMRVHQAKITAGQITQKMDKMQIKSHQLKKAEMVKSKPQKHPIVEDLPVPEPITSAADIEMDRKMNSVEFTYNSTIIPSAVDNEMDGKMSSVKFTYNSTLELLKGENKSFIRDIKVLRNDHIIMIDGNNNRLLISEMGGIKQSEFRLPGKPFCLAMAPDDTAAVSLYDKGKVVMVDIHKREIFREIVITCFGLVFTDDYLILNCGRTGIKMMDVYWNIVESVPEVRGDCYLFLGHDGHVYCNSCQSNQILRYNIRRKLVTTFSSLSIEHPLGTTIDDEGFIYEVGVQSPSVSIMSHEGSKAAESVHMISPSGRQHRLVLTKQDGVFNPYAVHFDLKRKYLFVANEFGESVVVFEKYYKDSNATELDVGGHDFSYNLGYASPYESRLDELSKKYF